MTRWDARKGAVVWLLITASPGKQFGVVEAANEDVGEADFAALYQGEPSQVAGSLFTRNQFADVAPRSTSSTR